MDSIGKLFGSLGGLFKSGAGGQAPKIGVGQILGASLGIPAIISQFQDAKRQNQYLDSIMSLMKQYGSITPAQQSADISALTKPLDASLVQSVSNPVQAFLGERGLGQAPGIAANTMTQALAPYAQQNIQNAIQEYFQGKALPIQAGTLGSYAFQPKTPTSLQGIISLLMGKGGPQAPTPAMNAINTGYRDAASNPGQGILGDVGGSPTDLSGLVGAFA